MLDLDTFRDNQVGPSCVDTNFENHSKFVCVLTDFFGAPQTDSFSEVEAIIWFLKSNYANVIREFTFT
jgi:hypothetical protein